MRFRARFRSDTNKQSSGADTRLANEVKSRKKPILALAPIPGSARAPLPRLFMQLRPTLRACSGTISTTNVECARSPDVVSAQQRSNDQHSLSRVGLPLVSSLWHNGSQLLE